MMLHWTPFPEPPAAHWMQAGRLTPVVGLLVLVALVLPLVAVPFVVALALLASLVGVAGTGDLHGVVASDPRARHRRTRGPPA